MGFLKRFLSLGSSKSRKNKKKQAPANAPVDAEGRILPGQLPQDVDSNANKLLRSSSTKFSVMSAIDYTNLPPLPPLREYPTHLLHIPGFSYLHSPLSQRPLGYPSFDPNSLTSHCGNNPWSFP